MTQLTHEEREVRLMTLRRAGRGWAWVWLTGWTRGHAVVMVIVEVVVGGRGQWWQEDRQTDRHTDRQTDTDRHRQTAKR